MIILQILSSVPMSITENKLYNLYTLLIKIRKSCSGGKKKVTDLNFQYMSLIIIMMSYFGRGIKGDSMKRMSLSDSDQWEEVSFS